MPPLRTTLNKRMAPGPWKWRRLLPSSDRHSRWFQTAVYFCAAHFLAVFTRLFATRNGGSTRAADSCSADTSWRKRTMTRYAMLTDEPGRLLRAYGRNGTLSVASFTSAVGALVWERGQRREGAVIFDSRGWRYGVVFDAERLNNASSPAATESEPAPLP